MESSPERVFLEDLERGLESGSAQEPDAALSLIAGRDVELDEDQLRGARRSALSSSSPQAAIRGEDRG